MKKLVLSLLVVLLAWSFFSVSYAKEKKNEREQDIIVTYVEREKTDLLNFIKEWRNREEKYKKKRTTIEKNIKEVLEYSEEYNIDPFFIIAVSLQETHGGLLSKGSSARVNNLFGITVPSTGEYESFKEPKDSIKRFAELIDKKYFKYGRKTIRSIEVKYCPEQNWGNDLMWFFQKMQESK